MNKNSFDKILKSIVKNMPQWIKPNHLTIFRFVLIGVLIWFFTKEYLLMSFFIFLLASFTDALDGTMARYRKQITLFGTIADPLADKLLIITIIVLLSQYVSWEIITALIIFEISTVLLGAYLFFNKKSKAQANIWGKIKMNIQVLAMALLFIQLFFKTVVFNSAITVLLVLSIFLLIISGFINLKNINK